MGSIAYRVNDYVTKLRPRAVCDDCIADALALSRRQQAARVSGALETTSDFVREIDECVTCHNVKKVIRRT